METQATKTAEHPVARKIGGVSLAIGIGMMVLGVIALADTFAVAVVSVILLGALLIASGITEIVTAIMRRGGEHNLVVGLAGVLALITGVLLLFNPVIGLASLTLVVGIFFLANGLYRLLAAAMSRYRNWGWDVAYGILAIALGIIVVSTWPGTTPFLIGTLIGIELLLRGASFLGIGFSAMSLARGRGRVAA